MTKLWGNNTGNQSDDQQYIEQYTVGDDPQLDHVLLPYDLKASQAHAKRLHALGVLDDTDLQILTDGFNHIAQLHADGKFLITTEMEDSHTAIELWLTEHCGEVGQKIHAGRSRNDQVLVAMQLYLRDQHQSFVQYIDHLSQALVRFADQHENINMPGFTHMQKAIPTTVGTWSRGFAIALDNQNDIFDDNGLHNLLNRNPLGSASGFGVEGCNDKKEVTTQALEFDETQHNPIACGLSRGLHEMSFLNALSGSVTVMSRLNADLLFFTANGHNYFTLPDWLTTGSSIMPQKKNIDPCEVLRGKCVQFFAAKSELEQLQLGLLSGYNRDIGLTKGVVMRALRLAEEIFTVMRIVVQNLQPHKENLEAAMTDDLFVTAKIYELVKQGVPFRQAYTQVKEDFFGED